MDELLRLKAKEAVENLSNYTNNIGNDPVHFAEAVMTQHRTLQQNMARCFFQCIYAWAVQYKDNRYDLRNEETCKIASLIVDKVLDSHGGGSLPYENFIFLF